MDYMWYSSGVRIVVQVPNGSRYPEKLNVYVDKIDFLKGVRVFQAYTCTPKIEKWLENYFSKWDRIGELHYAIKQKENELAEMERELSELKSQYSACKKFVCNK